MRSARLVAVLLMQDASKLHFSSSTMMMRQGWMMQGTRRHAALQQQQPPPQRAPLGPLTSSAQSFVLRHQRPPRNVVTAAMPAAAHHLATWRSFSSGSSSGSGTSGTKATAAAAAAAGVGAASKPVAPPIIRGSAIGSGSGSGAGAGAAGRVAARSTAAPRHASISETLRALAVEQLNAEPAAYASGDGVLDSIVKVFCVYSRPDWLLPWQAHPKREGTGTGFVVRDRLILTNAHVVADHTYIAVKRHGSGTKYRADVVAVGHAVDLALLTVADEAFWADPAPMLPLRLGDVPQLQESVRVIGYPTGGDNTSITSGVVSRVEVTQYVHAASHLMAVQIDASINPGNSGGPALRGSGDGNVVIGVAFQNLPSADSIGFIIPVPVIERFLSEVARHGGYRGYCSLGLVFQTLENSHLRASLGMAPAASGVLINRVQPTSSTAAVLRKGDVLLAFDGVRIANDGTVHFRARERIFFTSLITQKPTGSTARLTVLRDGAEAEFDVPLQPLQTLVPISKYDEVPSFLMYAGLVFTPLSQPYLHEFGEEWISSAPRRLVEKALHGLMQKPGQQVVILAQVLVDDVNTGFQSFQNMQVLRVDGVEVLNLRHLRALLAGAKGPYVRIELDDDRLVVLDKAAADASTPEIQRNYRVPFLESADVAAAADTDAADAIDVDAGDGGADGEAGVWQPHLAAAAAAAADAGGDGGGVATSESSSRSAEAATVAAAGDDAEPARKRQRKPAGGASLSGSAASTPDGGAE